MWIIWAEALIGLERKRLFEGEDWIERQRDQKAGKWDQNAIKQYLSTKKKLWGEDKDSLGR